MSGPCSRHKRGNLTLPAAVAVHLWPTPRVAAERNSRASLTRQGHWSAPALGQAVELAAGTLPREYHSEDELTPQARGIYEQAADLWPSPRATDGEKGGPNQHGRRGDLMLPSAVQPHHWPTATARDWRSGAASEATHARNARPLNEVVARIARAGHAETTLPAEDEDATPRQMAFWATPKSSPSGPDYARIGPTDSGGDDLATQMARLEGDRPRWRTPRARDGTGGGCAPARDDAQGHSVSLDDQTGSGQLSPNWVELLMNLPVGWTNPEVPNEALADWPGWPAPPGHAQHEYEVPRTGRGIKDRTKRLKALGNMVVPAQALPVFLAIMAVEREEQGESPDPTDKSGGLPLAPRY